MDVRVEDGSNRLVTPSRAQKAPPCTLVIFGAGGDLTKRLLMPAIYNLAKDKLLSEKFGIIAVDRTPKPIEAYRDYLAEGIRSFVSDTASAPATEPFDAQAWEFIASRITHFAGDLTEPDTYARLHQTLEKTAALHQTGGNAIFYLAVASQLFGTIVEQLGAAGLVQEKDNGFRRVIIEKPFGSDLASARALNAQILRVLSEAQIGWIISSARRRSRTSWCCALPTASSSRCGTATILTIFRSRWPKPSASSAARGSMRRRARCATWCQTMSFSFSA